ncbi:hypothetical protein [Caldivirga sp.]|uniref:hypothetical protein n=1 Tax=Caldivirga sp. TaxID=2080243 RepID=UPI0025C735B7|nr:hypothetical protein [Caldivirga sp.]
MGKAALMVALPMLIGLTNVDYAKLAKGDVSYNDSRDFVNKLCTSLNLYDWPKLVVIETAVYPISQILDLPGRNLEDIYIGMITVGELIAREVKAKIITITRSGGFKANEYSKVVPMPQWPKHPGEGIFITMGMLPISIMGKVSRLLNWYGELLNDLKEGTIDELSKEFMKMYKLSREGLIYIFPPIVDLDAGELRNALVDDAVLIHGELEKYLKRRGIKVRDTRV